MDRMGKIINRLAVLNRIDSNRRLKDFGLTSNEGTVLMILKDHQFVYQDTIIKELQIDKSAVTRLLHNMEVKELIRRVQDQNDKRCYLIKATTLGKQKQVLVDQVFEQKDRKLVIGLSENEEMELRRMLAIIKKNLGGSNDE